jgi:hypothetical protein
MTWRILALGWLVLGLLSYVAILRFFPPTPLLVEDQEADVPPIGRPRSFSVRDLLRIVIAVISDLPRIMIAVIPIALVSPILLVALVCHKLCKAAQTGAK